MLMPKPVIFNFIAYYLHIRTQTYKLAEQNDLKDLFYKLSTTESFK